MCQYLSDSPIDYDGSQVFVKVFLEVWPKMKKVWFCGLLDKTDLGHGGGQGAQTWAVRAVD